MEDLYMWKDMLLALFNLIDYNHSGWLIRFDFNHENLFVSRFYQSQ
jgi:hypothetical protein